MEEEFEDWWTFHVAEKYRGTNPIIGGDDMGVRLLEAIKTLAHEAFLAGAKAQRDMSDSPRE